jgi:hypothetical protein
MEVSLVGLFLLVRDSHGEAKCIGQACLMALTISLTVVYHRLLYRAFNPLLEFTPVAVKSAMAEDLTSSFPFRHQALESFSVIRLPQDEHGISSIEAHRLRKELPQVTVLANEATICPLGKIHVKTT